MNHYQLKLFGLILVCLLVVNLPVFGQEIQEYSESPILAEKVTEGELPPVEERLPDEPFIVGPGVLMEEEYLDWEPGRYSEGIDVAIVESAVDTEVFVMNNEPLLSSPRIGIDNIVGNIVESYEVENNNREFIFHIREGLKWSDGVPVTTEDVRFTYEDMLMNEKVTPVFPAHFRAGGNPDGEPMDLEILDKYTFKIAFNEPYGQFLAVLTIEGWRAYTELVKPSHYLKKYHIEYTPIEEMSSELEEEELDDEWWELLGIKDIVNWEMTGSRAVGFPVLYAWHRVESPEGIDVYKRNPYYFKVDLEGKQLPYIDEIRSHQVNDHETVLMKIFSGEVDFASADIRINEIPVLISQEESGGYDTHLLDMHTVSPVIYPNLTFDDETWREVVGDVRFRRALSMAIDRQEMIDSLYFKQAEVPQTDIMDPRYSIYNPEEANRLLDEMGMDNRDKDGYRLAPNGEKFEIYFEVFQRRPDIVPATELFVSYFDDLDLRASMKQISGQLRGTRMNANELMASVEYNSLQMMRKGYQQSDLLPSSWTNWGTTWALWYNTEGREGEEPPSWAQEIYDFNNRIRMAAPGSQEASSAWQDAFDWFKEHMPFIYAVDNVKQPLVASRSLGNIPHSGINIAAVFTAEQFFFKE